MATFPTPEWLQELMEKLNNDDQYAQIARNWEGDMVFKIDADGPLTESITYYLDLWHGKYRGVEVIPEDVNRDAVLIMRAPYLNIIKVIRGETQVVQALLTRKISVRGNMALLMRNVPTVLDFVRCCQEVTEDCL